MAPLCEKGALTEIPVGGELEAVAKLLKCNLHIKMHVADGRKKRKGKWHQLAIKNSCLSYTRTPCVVTFTARSPLLPPSLSPPSFHASVDRASVVIVAAASTPLPAYAPALLPLTPPLLLLLLLPPLPPRCLPEQLWERRRRSIRWMVSALPGPKLKSVVSRQ